MRIIVCLKQMRQHFARSGTDPDKYYLADEDHIFCINPYDEAAFELALQLKKKDKTCEIIILTLGPLISEKELRRCFSLGGDQLIRVETNTESEQLDPLQKSILLAKAVLELQGDVVLCGKESLDRRNGLVGAFLAHVLKRPFVSAIDQITIGRRNSEATLVRKVGHGEKEVWTCPLPAVFSVERSPRTLPFPSLADKNRADHYSIQTLIYPDLMADRTMGTSQTFFPRPRTKDIQTPGSQLSAFDRIQALFSRRQTEKKGVILKGSPESQVESIITFLIDKGFLKCKSNH